MAAHQADSHYKCLKLAISESGDQEPPPPNPPGLSDISQSESSKTKEPMAAHSGHPGSNQGMAEDETADVVGFL